MPEHPTPHHEEAEEKDALWEQEQAAYDSAKQLAAGKPQEELFTPEELASAFDPHIPTFMGCMDERVWIEGMKKIGNGGSGVLFSPEQRKAFAKQMKAKGIDINFVTSHDGCGACNLYCKKNELPAEQAPDLALMTATSTTELLKIKEAPRHIAFDAMRGSPDVHHARGVVVDCTSRFRPEALNANSAKFPVSFELSASSYPDLQQLEDELCVAISIAEGDHGMGVKFNASQGGQPMLLTFVEDPSDPDFSAEVEAIVKKVAADHPNTVRLVTLVAPKM